MFLEFNRQLEKPWLKTIDLMITALIKSLS